MSLTYFARVSLLRQPHLLFITFATLLHLVVLPGFAETHFANSFSPPRISYKSNVETSRNLIFLNNPEFLWASGGVCDLADEQKYGSKNPCGKSLFRIDSLRIGRFRAWWEHRNMMPFAIRSSLRLENSGDRDAIIQLEGDAIETNSFRNGGAEFVQLFNSLQTPKFIHLKPREKLLLGETSKKWIHPGNFFSGVSDFSVLQGQVTLDEIVFRRSPAQTLTTSDDSQRTTWGVHESLVYKGISGSSEVTLQGANFTINDESPRGAIPVSYHMSDIIGSDHTSGFCEPNQTPVCTGSALKKRDLPTLAHSWVTHIAPDIRDPNPKRKRAIMDDLIALTIPGSTDKCPSQWPMSVALTSIECITMSAHFHWYLPDFEHWRLPNWGNWAVHYHHPIRVTNDGLRDRTIALRVSADGQSPLAYRGSGVSFTWKQAFLDPKKQVSGAKDILVALSNVPSGSTVDLEGEFILSGPGAGTLEHHIEIID